MQDQGGESVSDPGGPELAEPALVRGPERVSGGSPMANPPQEGPAVSGEQHDMAPQPRAVEPSCVAASGTFVASWKRLRVVGEWRETGGVIANE